MTDDKQSESRPARRPRILVVEDQDSIRQFITTVLASAGHDVSVAPNGAQAVAAVRDAAFDLVLMDVSMPVMDGLTAAREIRALEGLGSKIPIIAISGGGQSPLDAAMSDHICKPFRRAALLSKVNAWLKGRPPSPLPEKSVVISVEEACALMGDPWAIRGLTQLKVQIDEAFSQASENVHDLEQLADQAHALVSLSAIFGFTTLSELCTILEEACRSGIDVPPIFAGARVAALATHRSAIDMIAAIQSRPP